MKSQKHDFKHDIFKQFKIIHLEFTRIQLYVKSFLESHSHLTTFAYCRLLPKEKMCKISC